VAERDRFFEGNPWYLLGLLAVSFAALARGEVWVVVIALAVAGVVIGVWYPHLALAQELSDARGQARKEAMGAIRKCHFPCAIMPMTHDRPQVYIAPGEIDDVAAKTKAPYAFARSPLELRWLRVDG